MFVPLRTCSIMLLSLLLLCHFFATVVAEIASPPPESLPKPGVPPVPNCNHDFSDLEKSQIVEGFRDAQYLASAAYEAVTSSPLHNSNSLTSDQASYGNDIYMKYFPGALTWAFSSVDPAEVVREIFRRTWMGQLNGCGNTLQDFLFSKDFDTAEFGFVCTEPEYSAETIDSESTTATIIICDSAFKHGAIGRRPDGFPPAVTCETIGHQTSWRMSTLGTTILHEWTHIGALVGDALASTHRDAEGAGDELDGVSIYGCIHTQAIADEDDALYVADNYAWFATEAFWSKQCGKSFRNPGFGDDQDPLLADQSGTGAKPIS